MGNWIINNIAIILIVFLLFNIFSFMLFFIDKRKAVKNKWRIPESTLILSSVFGIIGGLFGMYLIRHKTKKPKFFISLPLIFISEIAIIILLFVKFN